MTIDVLLLKERRGGGDPAAGQALLEDVGATQLFRQAMSSELFQQPWSYLAMVGPADAFDEPADLEAYRQTAEETRQQLDAAAGVDPYGGYLDMSPDERLAHFDGLDEGTQRAQVEAYDELAREWLSAIPDDADDTSGRPWGWGYHVATYDTTDGGRLLVCAGEEHDLYSDEGGVGYWFEAAGYALHEIAAAAGYTVPEHIDA